MTTDLTTSVPVLIALVVLAVVSMVARDRAAVKRAELEARLADSPSAPPAFDPEHHARRLMVLGSVRS